MSLEELCEYDIILNEHDNEWDMFKWLTGKEVGYNMVVLFFSFSFF